MQLTKCNTALATQHNPRNISEHTQWVLLMSLDILVNPSNLKADEKRDPGFDWLEGLVTLEEMVTITRWALTIM